MEIWKYVKGFEGKYQISNLGRVRSLERTKKCGRGGIYKVNERILKAGINSDGYKSVVLCNNNYRSVKVHVLVWDHFGGSERNGIRLQVDHIDNDKLNNNINNLQVITLRENVTKHRNTIKKSSKYTGVCWDKARTKWTSGIRINSVRKNLGRFESELDAHKAYQKELNNEIK